MYLTSNPLCPCLASCTQSQKPKFYVAQKSGSIVPRWPGRKVPPPSFFGYLFC